MTPEEGAAFLNEGYAGIAHNLDFNMFTEVYRNTVKDIRNALNE
jgi:hypothetical protein